MAEKVRGFLFTDIGYFLTKLPLNREKGRNGNNRQPPSVQASSHPPSLPLI